MVLNEFEMMLYQEITNNMPNHLTTQHTETELVPLKKGRSIDNALFDVEDDLQNNQIIRGYFTSNANQNGRGNCFTDLQIT